MSKIAAVTLADDLSEFVERKIRDGEYGSAEDVMNAGVRLLKEDEEKLEALRLALKEGEDSGYIDFDFDEFIARKRKRAKAS